MELTRGVLQATTARARSVACLEDVCTRNMAAVYDIFWRPATLNVVVDLIYLLLAAYGLVSNYFVRVRTMGDSASTQT